MHEIPLLDSNPKCEGCGACCMFMTVPPTSGRADCLEEIAADDAWWDSLPEALQDEINAVEGCSQPCVWLDVVTRKCKHYELRPPICRQFEPGCDVCLDDRAAVGIKDADR